MLKLSNGSTTLQEESKMFTAISSMFGGIKGYLALAGAAAAAIFIGIFKYRGIKIEDLEEDLEVAEHKAEVVEEVVKSEKSRVKFEAESRVKKAKAEARDYENITDTDYSI